MPIGPVWEAEIIKRGLRAETLERYGIYTGRRDRDGNVKPDRDGDVLCFPYFEDGVVVAEKYRTIDKKFWQKAGGKATFWNVDVMHERGLEEGYQRCIITEGEFDALTAIECGFETAVSVPDGAPAADNAAHAFEPLHPATEQTGKFKYLWRNLDKLKRVQKFIIAVDNDEPGKLLAAELVRRLGAWKCAFVLYPPGCKDLNDVLVKCGVEEVVRVIHGAMPYPVHGLYKLDEHPPMPEMNPLSTGWSILDQHLKVFPGEFMVVTGVPGHGKSSWMLNLVVNMVEVHDWKIVLFSPEMPVLPFLRERLRRLRTGWNDPKSDLWIEEKFVFIIADPVGDAVDHYNPGETR